jgi:acyl-coenzyme A thioesterase PaaI-like protein
VVFVGWVPQQSMARSLFAIGHWISKPQKLQLSWRRYQSSTTNAKHIDEQSDFLRHFIRKNKPPQSTLDYFASQPWASKILDDNAYEPVPVWSRHINEQTGENRFFAKTVNTDTTVPHILALNLKDLRTPEPTDVLQKDEPAPTSLSDVASHELIFLMALGEDLQAHPSIVHGGFQAIIFDEIMRLLILLHQNNICRPGPRDIHYTASMTVSYSAPVIAPSNVLVRAQLVRREGRKWFTKGEIVNTEGQILTNAESMWITAKLVGRS